MTEQLNNIKPKLPNCFKMNFFCGGYDNEQLEVLTERVTKVSKFEYDNQYGLEIGGKVKCCFLDYNDGKVINILAKLKDERILITQEHFKGDKIINKVKFLESKIRNIEFSEMDYDISDSSVEHVVTFSYQSVEFE